MYKGSSRGPMNVSEASRRTFDTAACLEDVEGPAHVTAAQRDQRLHALVIQLDTAGQETGGNQALPRAVWQHLVALVGATALDSDQGSA